MAEFPALPIWTDSYLADTRDLTAAQHGAYLLLLMTAWRTKENGLPDDDDKLARWAAMDKRTWLKNKTIIMGFWCKIDDLWHQKRLDDERKRAEYVRQSQSRAGIASALKRKGRHSTPVITEHVAPYQPPLSISTNPPSTPLATDEKKTRKKSQTFIPENFEGDDKAKALAEKLGVDYEREHRKFIAYWIANGKKKADWQATFRKWLDQSIEYSPKTKQFQQSNQNQTSGSTPVSMARTYLKMFEKTGRWLEQWPSIEQCKIMVGEKDG